MTSHESQGTDKLAHKLTSLAQHILVAVFGLLPIFFLPIAVAPFGYSKVLFVIVGVLLALVIYAFALLRSATISVRFGWAPLILWVIAFVALVSALLSGDFRDAFIGDAFGVHTTLFSVLLAFVASAWMIIGTNKLAIMRLFVLLAVSTLLLALFHVIRLVFGADVLTLGLFGGDATLSPFGGWNDVGIFFGLAIILALVALEQLPLTRWGQGLFALVVAVALLMLAVINFFAVWLILGLVSVVMLVYALIKDRFGSPRIEKKSTTSGVSLTVAGAVFVTSVIFVLGGGMIGNAIGERAGISYTEVRPSFTATTDIMRSVYSTDALFGVGPNRFADAWRVHKDPSLNESIFWNTDFPAGFGFIPTAFATHGLIGGIAWLAFLGIFTWTGIRMLLRTASTDRTWYFIGTASFAGGLFIWIMSIVYVPGPALLLIAALCTGLTAVAAGVLVNTAPREVSGFGNRRVGFVLVMAFLVLMVCTVSSLYFVGRHYAGVYAFNTSIRMIVEGAEIDAIEARTVQAYELTRNDTYARQLAQYQLVRMEELFTLAEPTEADRATFSDALNNGLNAASVAVSADDTNPQNWALLGNIYATLITADVEGAYEKAVEALTRARELDPQNPLRVLMLAQVAFAAEKEEEARQYVSEAVALKSNYTDAIFFLAQMDIAAGNIEEAIAATTAVTVLEPQNPVRFLQLGVLQLSDSQYATAAASLERAVALNPAYANARYYLALAYDMLDRTEDARTQLRIIEETNPNNELVNQLLSRLAAGQPLIQEAAPQTPAVEEAPVSEENGTVTTDSPSDTPLVTPVNTPSEAE